MINFAGESFICNSKLCSLLGPRKTLLEPSLLFIIDDSKLSNRGANIGSSSVVKRAPGMEFLGKRSLHKRVPGRFCIIIAILAVQIERKCKK